MDHPLKRSLDHEPSRACSLAIGLASLAESVYLMDIFLLELGTQNLILKRFDILLTTKKIDFPYLKGIYETVQEQWLHIEMS